MLAAIRRCSMHLAAAWTMAVVSLSAGAAVEYGNRTSTAAATFHHSHGGLTRGANIRCIGLCIHSWLRSVWTTARRQVDLMALLWGVCHVGGDTVLLLNTGVVRYPRHPELGTAGPSPLSMIAVTRRSLLASASDRNRTFAPGRFSGTFST